MSDAPEQIWAWPEPDDGLSDQVDDWGWVYGDWDRSQPEDGLGVQYVRADLFAATLARAERAEAALAEAEAAGMRRAAAICQREVDSWPSRATDYACGASDAAQGLKRAILAAIPPAAQWTPPEDRPDGYQCLGWCDGEWLHSVWLPPVWRWVSEGGDVLEPTHFRPMPPAPAQEGEP